MANWDRNEFMADVEHALVERHERRRNEEEQKRLEELAAKRREEGLRQQQLATRNALANQVLSTIPNLIREAPVDRAVVRLFCPSDLREKIQQESAFHPHGFEVSYVDGDFVAKHDNPFVKRLMERLMMLRERFDIRITGETVTINDQHRLFLAILLPKENAS